MFVQPTVADRIGDGDSDVRGTGLASQAQQLQGLGLGEQRPDLIPLFVNAMPTPAVEPADVSNAVLFLLSDESRYVTGLQFKVDAGVTIN